MQLTSNTFDLIVSQSVATILSGGVVVLPFDTTYGYVCNPRNESALLKIFHLKRRALSETIGTAVNNTETLKKISETNKENEKFIQERAPGKFTFVLINKSKNISTFCLRNKTIAVRIPDNELVLTITEKAGGIIAQTSANVSGRPNCNSINELSNQLNTDEFDSIDIIVDDGNIESSGSSQIFDLTSTMPQEIERK